MLVLKITCDTHTTINNFFYTCNLECEREDIILLLISVNSRMLLSLSLVTLWTWSGYSTDSEPC